MENLKRKMKVFLFLLLAGVFALSGLLYRSSNETVLAVSKQAQNETAVRDKTTNTARIVEKDAWWTDQDNFEANLLLKVNGSSLSGPMDVVFVLDRSGSMDMTYTDNANTLQADGSDYRGFPLYSCPCLNQNHFYLKPQEITQEPENNPDKNKVYKNEDETLTVYNADKDQWVKLGKNPVHLYEQFTPESSIYIPYHFRLEGDDYVRISHWDPTAKVAGKTTDGVWVHADEEQGCYDRWMLSKNAISAVSEKLFNEHPDNRIALVPFSIRDTTMTDHLNFSSLRMQHFRDNLISQNAKNGYFSASTGTSVEDGKIIGSYNSKVGWKDTIEENEAAINDMLPRLFTTPQTDYQYGLSMAYNLLQSRSDEAKASKGAMVVFLSDGVPQSTATMRLGWGGGGGIVSFGQTNERILSMSEAITSSNPTSIEGALTGGYQRHEINPAYLTSLGGENYEAQGMGAEMISVDYMANSSILKEMASNQQSYLEVPANNVGAGADYLSDLLLNSTIFPGGRNSVLRDEVSQYYYVPEDAQLPEGVTIEGNYEDNKEAQTIVWNLGDLYDYAPEDYPTINIPLVLKEEYRDVARNTYYPTNADTSEVGTDIYDAERGTDDENTGAKLYYTNPTNKRRYDTIGTPKLEVLPPKSVKLSVKKMDETGEILQGSAFELRQGLDFSGDEVNDWNNLTEGDYSIREQLAPDGYVLDEVNYSFSVNRSGQFTFLSAEAGSTGQSGFTVIDGQLVLNNYNKRQIRLQVVKVDADFNNPAIDDFGHPMQGVQFVLAPTTALLTRAVTQEMPLVSDEKGVLTTEDDATEVHLAHGSSQTLRMIHQPIEGFYLHEDVYTISVDESGTPKVTKTLSGQVENIPFTFEDGLIRFVIQSELDFDFILNKVDGNHPDSKEKLDASFTLSAHEESNFDFLTNFKNATSIDNKFVEVETVKTTNGTLDLSQTIGDTPNLDRGKIYKLSEVKAPTGFSLSKYSILAYEDIDQEIYIRLAEETGSGALKIRDFDEVYQNFISVDSANSRVVVNFPNFKENETPVPQPTNGEENINKGFFGEFGANDAAMLTVFGLVFVMIGLLVYQGRRKNSDK